MIFFIHIPKTAGTTFYELVKKNHNQFLKPKIETISFNKIANIKNSLAIRLPGGYTTAPQTLKAVLEANNNNIKFIGGHVGYGYHEEIKDKVNYISFVREPRARVLSDYNNQCKSGTHFYNLLSAKNFDINYYFELVLNDKLDNIMTRQIAGPYDFYLQDRKLVDENLCQLAVENLENITFFNLNNFDEALKYMSKKFNWNYLKYERKNVAKTYKTPSHIIDESLLNEVIQYDLKLFNSIKVVNDKKMSTLEKLFFKFNNW